MSNSGQKLQRMTREQEHKLGKLGQSALGLLANHRVLLVPITINGQIRTAIGIEIEQPDGAIHHIPIAMVLQESDDHFPALFPDEPEDNFLGRTQAKADGDGNLQFVLPTKNH